MRTRSAEGELMDRADISFAEFSRCLASLERINILTLAYRPTLRWLDGVLRTDDGLHILDAGSGGGDMLRRIARLARRRKKSVRLTGVDANPWSQRYAEGRNEDAAIYYETRDALAASSGPPPDIVISSLFAHHLDDAELVRFLRWMHGAAGRGWFINDLHRHRLPWLVIRAATRLFSRNRLIRHDAAVSVARAFTADDWRRLLREAGITDPGVRVSWHFPFRYCVSCLKP
jgi:2-polyprenyl-3-methyl-5-hydroxy-6-metoxy-1,4-benzoquinol methylase